MTLKKLSSKLDELEIRQYMWGERLLLSVGGPVCCEEIVVVSVYYARGNDVMAFSL